MKFGWLQYLLSGTRAVKPGTLSQRGLKSEPKTLSQQRDDYIEELKVAAESEEAKNKELEERLEFKKREGEVLGRIQEARSRREKLWGLLGDYGARRPRLLRWTIVGVGIFLLLLLLIKC